MKLNLDLAETVLLSNVLQAYRCTSKVIQDDNEQLAENLMDKLCKHLDAIDSNPAIKNDFDRDVADLRK